MENIKKILDFLNIAEKLKCELRHGWTSTGRQESVADHCWRLSLMVILFEPYLDQQINLEKALKMAVLHDLAEAITGDIPFFLAPEGSSAHAHKEQKELESMNQLTNILESNLGSQIFSVWEEYEKMETYESKLIKALDKIEALIQRNETDITNWTDYEIEHAAERLNKYCDFDSFINSTKEVIQNQTAKKINNSLQSKT